MSEAILNVRPSPSSSFRGFMVIGLDTFLLKLDVGHVISEKKKLE